jgi:hypothetical protein
MFACNSKLSPFSGYKGVVQYQHEPKTAYQLRSRKKDATDLQQYTRSLLPSKVERFVMFQSGASRALAELNPLACATFPFGPKLTSGVRRLHMRQS